MTGWSLKIATAFAALSAAFALALVFTIGDAATAAADCVDPAAAACGR